MAFQAQVGKRVFTRFPPGFELPFDLRCHLEVGDAFDWTSVLIVTSYIMFRAVATTIKITDLLASCWKTKQNQEEVPDPKSLASMHPETHTSPFTHTHHCGVVSSQRMCLFLQVLQPFLDFVWLLRN